MTYNPAPAVVSSREAADVPADAGAGGKGHGACRWFGVAGRIGQVSPVLNLLVGIVSGGEMSHANKVLGSAHRLWFYTERFIYRVRTR